MRIALLVPEFTPNVVGGGAVVYEELATRYSHVADVHVWTLSPTSRPKTYSLRASAGPVVVLQLPVARRLRPREVGWSVAPVSTRGLLRLGRDIGEWRPDVVHAHGLGHVGIDLALAIVRRHRIPYIFTVHGEPESWRRSSLATQLGYRALRWYEHRHTVARAASLTSVSRFAWSGPRPAQIVPNGVSPLPLVPPGGADAIVTRLGLHDLDRPVVLGAGRLAHEKGFDLLLRATEALQGAIGTVLLAGDDGGELLPLRALAATCRTPTHFLGHLSRPQLAEVMRTSDMVVVASRVEPFGLVALETLEAGVPLVVSLAGAGEEFFRNSPVPRFEPNDLAGLIAAMKARLASGGVTSEERHFAAQLLASLSWNRSARSYLEMLGELAP